jgi:virginiamycin B lyase
VRFVPVHAQDLSEGPRKETVAAICGGCHGINVIRGGYTPAGWHTVVGMMQNVGAAMPPDQRQTVTEYLIKNFPERPRPAAAVIDGPVMASIEGWPVTTLASRPHGPRVTKDGATWYTGHCQQLGRLDLKTGEISQVPLTKNSVKRSG